MLKRFIRLIRKKLNPTWHSGAKYQDINPEDVFLDSANLPGFDETRFEGRIEMPVGAKTFLVVKIVSVILVFGLGFKLWSLGVINGEIYAEISDNNRLEQTIIFSNRGLIYDRNMVELATNELREENDDFAGRVYADIPGIAHVVGYVKYPLADRSGFYYEENYRGQDGVERSFDESLRGTNGLRLREIDAVGNITSEAIVRRPIDGAELVLSIDSRLSKVLYKSIEALALDKGFTGGAGVILDIKTGEVIALTSYPEYDSNVLTDGSDRATIDNWLSSASKPFLNRAVGGLYTPGSIIKPIVALAALNEGIISPDKEIQSTGSIVVENPYDPAKPSIFKDWKAHGWTDMRRALAVSSDTYFYYIGGGFGNQKGLGITALDKYFKLFGLAELTGINLGGELEGVIPTPEWKKERFNNEPWRLGDTYITSIGQYGTQATPLNMARYIAAFANGGLILKPSLTVGGTSDSIVRALNFNAEDWQIVREGMREAVSYGTSVGLNVPYVKIAAKTGTAEVGSSKLYVNSWSVGFFPFDNPQYAWATVMEKGPSSNTVGATFVMRQLFDWMATNAPEYLTASREN